MSSRERAMRIIGVALIVPPVGVGRGKTGVGRTFDLRQTAAGEIGMLRFMCQRGWIPHRWGERLENGDGEGFQLCRRCGSHRSGRPFDPPPDAPQPLSDR